MHEAIQSIPLTHATLTGISKAEWWFGATILITPSEKVGSSEEFVIIATVKAITVDQNHLRLHFESDLWLKDDDKIRYIHLCTETGTFWLIREKNGQEITPHRVTCARLDPLQGPKRGFSSLSDSKTMPRHLRRGIFI